MKTLSWAIRILFILFFTLSFLYITTIETERYESSTLITIKDLSSKQEINLSSFLSGQGSDTLKDSKILELFIRSWEMYQHLDKHFHLTAYYTGNQMDPLRRLYKNTSIRYIEKNNQNLLNAYSQDLSVIYDTLSQTLTLKFAHADKNISRDILKEIIRYSDETINRFSRESARVSLAFIKSQVEENRKAFIASIKKLVDYQHKHYTFDPSIDVERKNTILAELEADLAKKEVEYSSKKRTGWNTNGYEMRTLHANIQDIKRSIKKLTKELSGNQQNGKELNANVFDFEVLKNEMEFAKEVYKETLINQEKLKIEVNQNAKHIVVISQPTLPDEYTYPDKVWDIFSLTLLLLLLYSIIITILGIIRDHQD